MNGTDIKPEYATFEQSILLKTLGFEEFNCETWKELSENCMAMQYDPESCVQIPEQWMVTEWLRVKYDIWIHVYYLVDNNCWGWDCYRYEVGKLINEPTISFGMKLQTPQDSYSAAFDYILKELL